MTDSSKLNRMKYENFYQVVLFMMSISFSQC